MQQRFGLLNMPQQTNLQAPAFNNLRQTLATQFQNPNYQQQAPSFTPIGNNMNIPRTMGVNVASVPQQAPNPWPYSIPQSPLLNQIVNAPSNNIFGNFFRNALNKYYTG